MGECWVSNSESQHRSVTFFVTTITRRQKWYHISVVVLLFVNHKSASSMMMTITLRFLEKKKKYWSRTRCSVSERTWHALRMRTITPRARGARRGRSPRAPRNLFMHLQLWWLLLGDKVEADRKIGKECAARFFGLSNRSSGLDTVEKMPSRRISYDDNNNNTGTLIQESDMNYIWITERRKWIFRFSNNKIEVRENI